MRKWVHSVLLLSCACVATPALAGGNAAAVLRPVHQFIDGMDAANAKASAAAFAPNASIIDEFAPYHWQGDDAFAKWDADFGAWAKAGGVSDVFITLRKPKHLNVSADHAYAVVPTLITFRQKGKKMREHGTFTFALTETATGWRIAAWAWATK
jgi:hypothetical protein